MERGLGCIRIQSHIRIRIRIRVPSTGSSHSVSYRILHDHERPTIDIDVCILQQNRIAPPWQRAGIFGFGERATSARSNPGAVSTRP